MCIPARLSHVVSGDRRAWTSKEAMEYARVGIASEVSVDALVEQADFRDFQERWLEAEPRQEAMFRAFFLDPAIRATYAAMTGR